MIGSKWREKKEIKRKLKEEKIHLAAVKKKEIKDAGGYIRYKFKAFMKTTLGIKTKEFCNWLLMRLEKSIRFELMVVFAFCFIISILFYGIANPVLQKEKIITSIVYNYESIDYKAESLAQGVQKLELGDLNDKDKIKVELDKYIDSNSYSNGDISRKVYLTDLDGNVKYNYKQDGVEKVDIFGVINESSSSKREGSERTILYPVKSGDTRAYLIYAETPAPQINEEVYNVRYSFLALLASVIVFIALFTIITNKKMKYIDEIAKGLQIIARGNLDYRIEERGKDEIKNLAYNINTMAEEVKFRIEKERIAEKTKGELITNVSHDLRTPLTSVMGYIGLVKDEKYEDKKMMKEYLEIAFSKSNQLKELIEDLFEYTKLNNKGVVLNKEQINFPDFLSQLIEEYIPLFDEEKLNVNKNFLTDRAIVDIDTGKIIRVFENLFTNAIKYSFKPGNIMITVYKELGYVYVAIKNNGENISKEKMDRIFDRFYRVDEARNSEVKGSGLGLAISKNIIQLHGGEIYGECVGNEITFFVKLRIISNL